MFAYIGHMAKKKTPPKKAKPEKNKKVASARQAKPVAKAAKKVAAKAKAPVPAKKAAPVKPTKEALKAAKPAKSAPVKAGKPTEATLAAAKAALLSAAKKGKQVEGKKGAKEATALPPELAAVESEVILTNADGKRYCKVGECDELATSDSYCRYHYLLNWKKIQLRKKILAGDKLNRYIEELTARYPDKYLEMIRKDLATDKDFLAALQELEIDEGAEDTEYEDDSKTYIDEVRGTTSGGGGQEEDDY